MPILEAESLGLNNHVLRVGYLCRPTGSVSHSWTPEELRPYVLYLQNGVAVDAFWGGLLFEADLSNRGVLLSARAIGLGKPPTVAAWRKAYKELFAEGRNVTAAVELSRERPPGRWLDIWIALPYPLVSTEEFGVVGEQLLHFGERAEDRITALQWWMRRIDHAWQRCGLQTPGHQARLCGFVWGKSFISPEDEEIARAAIDYAHQLGYKVMWCQNYGTAKSIEGKTAFGFDLICTHPPFTGQEPRGVTWVKYAAALSTYYGMGMVLRGKTRDLMLDLLNVGTELFPTAFQVYDLPEKALLTFYQTGDPMYSYLYRYTKREFQKIWYPGMTY